MKNKNTFLTLIAFLMLGFGNCYGAADEEVKSRPKTIASVTKFMQEEFRMLEQKLKTLADTQSVKENLGSLAEYGAREFQALTGLIPEKMLVDKGFHENILREYEGGLKFFSEIKKFSQEDESFINLVRQRIEYYGNIMDIYAQDPETFFLKSEFLGVLWGDKTSNTYLRDPLVVFLTIRVEEEKDAAEALALLNKISTLSGGNLYKAYSSFSLCAERQKVTGELNSRALQDFLETEEKRIIEEGWENVLLDETQEARAEEITREGLSSRNKKTRRRARRRLARSAADQAQIVAERAES